MGLGLPVAKEIVESHRGIIEATSDEDYTHFDIKLPIKGEMFYQKIKYSCSV